jgi:hypothetical protein
MTQTIAAAPAANTEGGAVTFDASVIGGTGISFVAPSSLVISTPGVYEITWEVFPTPGSSAFALFFVPTGSATAIMVPCSNYGTNSGNQPYDGQVVTTLGSTGVLTLNRIDPTGTVTLQVNIDGLGGTAVVSASIVIERLA